MEIREVLTKDALAFCSNLQKQDQGETEHFLAAKTQ
jgi:hypothetical protein